MSEMMINFTHEPDIRQRGSGVVRDPVPKPVNSDGKLLTRKQIRARARRRMSRASKIMSDEEFDYMFKPVEEWDLEELARGRPRNMQGNFRGAKPQWITRDVHERSMDLFRKAVKMEMNAAAPTAINIIYAMLENEEVDDKGKPVVPWATKFQAATFLLEHIVGKPTQRVENDLSVKLQAILGVVMANPAEAITDQGYTLAHMPGITMDMGAAAEEDIMDADIVDDSDG